MSSASGPGQPGPPQQGDGPYPPRNIGMGGKPSAVPDIPIPSVFLVLYLVFAVVHIKIMNCNKSRGHKFIFNGALFGFCKIRVITMCLRIASACYPGGIGLGIAAQVFVYVGTIILYLCNWFFAQRVVRAQHPRFGWSTSYRAVHRGGMIALVAALFMIMVASIQQFFTLNPNTLRIDRDLQLAGSTYFAAFTLAPLVLLAFSLALPRKGTEKFGFGRLRRAIAVLFVGSAILALGQCFRTAIGWLPEIPLRNAQGQPNGVPWYYSKASFYCFNLLTELLVVVFYAVMRVDLRFYIPDGAKQPGDYSKWRESQFNVHILGNEHSVTRSFGQAGSVRSVTKFWSSGESSLRQQEASICEDRRTLDDKTGHWNIKRQSDGSIRSSMRPSSRSQSSLRAPSLAPLPQEMAPPIPQPDWPVRESPAQVGRVPSTGHSLGPSSRSSQHSPYLTQMQLADSDKRNATDAAIGTLEGASTPPEYDCIAPPSHKKTYQPPCSDLPRKHTYAHASPPAPDIPLKKDYTPSFPPSSDIPYKHNYAPTSSASSSRTSPSVSSDMTAKKNDAAPAVVPASPLRKPSLTHSSGLGRNISAEAVERESGRSSFEASARDGGFEGSERGQRRST